MSQTDIGIIGPWSVGSRLICSCSLGTTVVGGSLIWVRRKVIALGSITTSILLRSLRLLGSNMLLRRRWEDRLREGRGCGRILAV